VITIPPAGLVIQAAVAAMIGLSMRTAEPVIGVNMQIPGVTRVENDIAVTH
jgi:hypothetical protein